MLRLAAFIVRLYPRAWRRRYADEMIAVFEQSPPRWSDVLDLASVGISEWLRVSGVVRVIAAILSAAACSWGGAGLAVSIGHPGDLSPMLLPVVSAAFVAVSVWAVVARERAYRLPDHRPQRLDAVGAACLSAVLICLEAAWRLGAGYPKATWWLAAGPGLSWYATYYALTAWIRPPVCHTVTSGTGEADR